MSKRHGAKRAAKLHEDPNFETKMWPVKTVRERMMNGTLRLPRLNRKNTWDETKDKAFIEFVREFQNLVMPVVLHECIKNEATRYIIIDGNNRVSALLKFLECPLPLLGGKVLPSHKSAALATFDCLKLVDYDALCNAKNVRHVFELALKDEGLEQGTRAELVVAQTKLSNEPALATQMEAWHDDVREELMGASNFLQLNVPVTVYKGPPENIPKLFASINNKTTPLTEAQLLNCLLNETSITFAGNPALHAQLRECVGQFYADKADSAMVEVDVLEDEDEMNAFEACMGVLLYYARSYTSIGWPKEASAPAQTFIINLWRLHARCVTVPSRMDAEFLSTFTDANFKTFVASLDASLAVVKRALDWLLPIRFAAQHLPPLRHLLVLLSAAMGGAPEQQIRKMHILYALELQGPVLGPAGVWECLKYRQAEQALPTLSAADFKAAALRLALEGSKPDTVDGKKEKVRGERGKMVARIRRQWAPVTELALAAFSYVHCSEAARKEPACLDHLFAYGSTWEGALDINHMGNAVYMSVERNNRKRSRSQFETREYYAQTSAERAEWVRQFNYPSEAAYFAVWTNDTIVDTAKYTQLVEERAEYYINSLVKVYDPKA